MSCLRALFSSCAKNAYLPAACRPAASRVCTAAALLRLARCLGAIIALACASGLAQSATIEVLVHDALGQPIAQVQLTLKGQDGQVLAQGASDASGSYRFSGVAPGAYAVLGERPGYQGGASVVLLPSEDPVRTELTLASEQALELHVAAQRLGSARSGLTAQGGGSVYHLGSGNTDSLPQGSDTAFNQVLLQAPGVANDSYGQLHVRGDHGNLQYRINGVILPEGISGFGQALDTRFARDIDLLTGALPAQYGLRTAGVVEIQTRDKVEAGGRVDLTLGSRNAVSTGLEFGATQGNLSYYLTGSLLQNSIGIENPSASTDPLHDQTQQAKGFAYFSYLLDAQSKLSLMLGSYDGRFQIPDNPGQVADPNGQGFLSHAGLASFDSANLDANQAELNRYAVLAYQGAAGDDLDYQLSLFAQHASVAYTPDALGDLVFNGVASQVTRSSDNQGLQADAAYRLNDDHRLRFGSYLSFASVRVDNTSTVFALDAAGKASGAPFAIVDNNSKDGLRQQSLYIQDEWDASEHLTVQYGVRADQVDAFVSEGQLSPRVGLSYKTGPLTTVHAAYARYFTPPPFERVSTQTLTLFSGTSNAPQNGQNDPVQSERSDTVDLGVAHQLTREWQLGVDSYYKKVTNTLDEGQFGQSLIYTPFNYAEGKISGVELSLDYRSKNVTGYFNLAKSQSLARQINSAQFNFSADELDYIANNWVHTDHDQEYTASAGISVLREGTRYSADLIYGSGLRSGFANSDTLPAYTQVNAGVARKMAFTPTGTLEARFAVINVFDTSYEIRDGTGIGVGAPQYGPRRAFFLGLSKLF